MAPTVGLDHYGAPIFLQAVRFQRMRRLRHARVKILRYKRHDHDGAFRHKAADAAGVVHGNDWCEGFVAGMELLNDDWGLLFESPENSPLLEPVMALGFERHPDAEMRPFVEAISAEQRAELLAAISPSVHGIHDFFAAIRRQLEQEERELEKNPDRRAH